MILKCEIISVIITLLLLYLQVVKQVQEEAARQQAPQGSFGKGSMGIMPQQQQPQQTVMGGSNQMVMPPPQQQMQMPIRPVNMPGGMQVNPSTGPQPGPNATGHMGMGGMHMGGPNVNMGNRMPLPTMDQSWGPRYGAPGNGGQQVGMGQPNMRPMTPNIMGAQGQQQQMGAMGNAAIGQLIGSGVAGPNPMQPYK